MTTARLRFICIKQAVICCIFVSVIVRDFVMPVDAWFVALGFAFSWLAMRDMDRDIEELRAHQKRLRKETGIASDHHNA